MIAKPKELKQIQLNETALIWDESDRGFVVGYRTDWRRQKVVTFLDKITFEVAITTYTSRQFHCAGYRDMLLLVNLDVTGAPTDIVLSVEFSDDSANWFKYMIGPFGDLRWEDGAGDKKESLNLPCLAPYVRVKGVATGTGAGATFLMTVKGVFNG